MSRSNRIELKRTLELRSTVGVCLFVALALFSLTPVAGQSATLTIGNGHPQAIYAQAVALEETPTPTVTPSPTPAPAGSPLDQIRHAQNADILWHIYGLESSWGKNDSCADSGKVNGFGFRVNRFETHCYDTFSAALQDVDQWFVDHLKTMTLDEALCTYNEGVTRSDCRYVKEYEAL